MAEYSRNHSNLEVEGCDWCLHYQSTLDGEFSYSDLCFAIANSFNDAEIITSNIHSTIRLISLYIISRRMLMDKLSYRFKVTVLDPYHDEIFAIIKEKQQICIM